MDAKENVNLSSEPIQTSGATHDSPAPQASLSSQAPQAAQASQAALAPQAAQSGAPSGAGTSHAVIVEQLRQMGADPSRYGFQDDSAVLQVTAGLLNNWDRINEAIMLAEAVAPHLDKIRPIIAGEAASAQASQAPQTPPPGMPQEKTSPQEEKPYWVPPPEWKDDWLRYLAVDATGQVRAINPLYEKYADAYRARQEWEKQAVEKILSDPVGLVIKSPDFQKAVQEAINSEIERRRSHESLRSLVAQNADKFFQFDQNGNPVVNPVTGEPVLTPVGRFAHEFVRWASTADYEGLLNIALQIGQLLSGAASQAQQQSFSQQSFSPQSAAPPSPPVASAPAAPPPPAAPPSPPSPGAERRFNTRGGGGAAQPPAANGANFRELLYQNARQLGVLL